MGGGGEREGVSVFLSVLVLVFGGVGMCVFCWLFVGWFVYTFAGGNGSTWFEWISGFSFHDVIEEL